jgi:hypothetical protein
MNITFPKLDFNAYAAGTWHIPEETLEAESSQVVEEDPEVDPS